MRCLIGLMVVGVLGMSGEAGARSKLPSHKSPFSFSLSSPELDFGKHFDAEARASGDEEPRRERPPRGHRRSRRSGSGRRHRDF